MPERPLLILPVPGEPVKRQKRTSGMGRFQRPSRERQAERLTPRFEELQRALEARRAKLLTEARGLVPEEVVVLETIGTVERFIGAVEKISGMEWLSEVEKEDIPPDDDFFALDDDNAPRSDKSLRGRLFMIFTNQSALRQMLSLWDAWQASRSLPHGLRAWKRLFEQLRDVRPWGVRDRLLETGILEDWQERVEHGQELVPCEIELWYRQAPGQRRVARDRVTGLVAALGGEVLNEAVVEEIAYHTLLTRIPTGSILTLLQAATDAELVQCEQIQFFRASGQMAAVRPDGEYQHDEPFNEEATPSGPPIVALFDGLPLQRHRRLEGHLILDDPDDFEARYQANERRHGTSMASLILYGDLAARDAVLARPLYVRPILTPDSRDWRSPRHETVPEDTLIVDLLHRAVRRLFEGEAGEPPVAPNVVVINLSIGIQDRPFDGTLSPLARLLDWLAWRYKTLFLISAGNHTHRIELACTKAALSALTPAEIQSHIIRAVATDSRHRRLLSPAEAVNVLTVGALHEDISNSALPPRWILPYTGVGLPSPINAQGMGYRRAIKPDILAPGGRVVVQEHLGSATNASLNIYDQTLSPGQMVAAPGHSIGDRNSIWYSRGTSNATALASRAAALLHDVLDELRGLPGGEIVGTVPLAVWLKALLAHGADWGPGGSVLEDLLKTPENSRQLKEYLTRLLGYGSIDVGKVSECTAYRATAISCGLLTGDQSHIHRFPLPPSLSGQQGKRKMIVTLAWLTPVNPRHLSWRRAQLWFAPPQEPLYVARRQADWHAVQRGTLQHEILEGADAAVFVDGANLEIQVSCRADAGALEDQVPYALVITLEIAEEMGVPIYEEVRVRVQERVRVAALPG